MMKLMAAQVHLVGGDPWWHQAIGSALIAVTAIVAAWIAARTANRRQQEQLSHDRDLQKAQLSHDRDLQMAQLAYDREQRNRQHVRDAIDSAVRSLYAAVKHLAQYQALILTGDEKRDKDRKVSDDETLSDAERDAAIRSYEETMNEIGAATLKGFEVSAELMSESVRLSLRLGVEHPICETHAVYREAYGACFEILNNLPTVKMSDEERNNVETASAAEGAAMSDFLSSCRRWFEDEQRTANA